MGKLFADPRHQFFGCFNAFFSRIWQKTRVGLVSRKVFGLWCTLGHPNVLSNKAVHARSDGLLLVVLWSFPAALLLLYYLVESGNCLFVARLEGFISF